MKNKILLSSLMAMTLFSPVFAEDSNNKNPWYKTKTAYFVYAATGVTLTLAALEYYEITHIKDFVSNLISSDSSTDGDNTEVTLDSNTTTPEVASEIVDTEVEATDSGPEASNNLETAEIVASNFRSDDSNTETVAIATIAEESQDQQITSPESSKAISPKSSLEEKAENQAQKLFSGVKNLAQTLSVPVARKAKEIKQEIEEKYPTSTLHAFVENVKGTAKSAVDGVAEATHAKEIKNSIDAKAAEFVKQHPAAVTKTIEIVEHIGTGETVPGGHFE